jgi:hypothetical protein
MTELRKYRYVKPHAYHVTRYIFTMLFYTRELCVPKWMLVGETWFFTVTYAYDRGAHESIWTSQKKNTTEKFTQWAALVIWLLYQILFILSYKGGPGGCSFQHTSEANKTYTFWIRKSWRKRTLARPKHREGKIVVHILKKSSVTDSEYTTHSWSKRTASLLY